MVDGSTATSELIVGHSTKSLLLKVLFQLLKDALLTLEGRKTVSTPLISASLNCTKKLVFLNWLSARGFLTA